ncbi:hypothetical protein JZ751_016957 [Albula glossodonta]|uniref:Adrenomedullin n=1 Tax=Albula glossodonta TaxID=121402 RepID=A0A8T2MVV7_9TELE|nr:hypothetical protein JZ751_016957 [Albula glossodonta]
MFDTSAVTAPACGCAIDPGRGPPGLLTQNRVNDRAPHGSSEIAKMRKGKAQDNIQLEHRNPKHSNHEEHCSQNHSNHEEHRSPNHSNHEEHRSPNHSNHEEHRSPNHSNHEEHRSPNHSNHEEHRNPSHSNHEEHRSPNHSNHEEHRSPNPNPNPNQPVIIQPQDSPVLVFGTQDPKSFKTLKMFLRASDTMKLLLQSLLCCCLLAAVAPGAHSAKLDSSSKMTKRLSIWLQSRSKRDVSSTSVVSRADSVQFVRPEDVRDTLIPHSSASGSVRVRRSWNTVSQRRPGCALGTCTVHDLAHRIHQLNNKLKIGSAPIDKISPLGYGRRRRSLPERRLALRLGGGGGRAARGGGGAGGGAARGGGGGGSGGGGGAPAFWPVLKHCRCFRLLSKCSQRHTWLWAVGDKHSLGELSREGGTDLGLAGDGTGQREAADRQLGRACMWGNPHSLRTMGPDTALCLSRRCLEHSSSLFLGLGMCGSVRSSSISASNHPCAAWPEVQTETLCSHTAASTHCIRTDSTLRSHIAVSAHCMGQTLCCAATLLQVHTAQDRLYAAQPHCSERTLHGTDSMLRSHIAGLITIPPRVVRGRLHSSPSSGALGLLALLLSGWSSCITCTPGPDPLHLLRAAQHVQEVCYSPSSHCTPGPDPLQLTSAAVMLRHMERGRRRVRNPDDEEERYPPSEAPAQPQRGALISTWGI